tara:strand:- start:235 stop:507 length:273 start_codon:yes stop_codon:yes gene_type:complete
MTYTLTYKALRAVLSRTSKFVKVQLNVFDSKGKVHTDFFFKATIQQGDVTLHNVPKTLEVPFAYTPYYQESANTYKLLGYHNECKLQVKF